MQHLDVFLTIIIVAIAILQFKSIVNWFLTVPAGKDSSTELLVPTDRPEPVMLGSATATEEIKVEEVVVEEMQAEEKEVAVDWRMYVVPTYRRRGIELGLPSSVAAEVDAVKEAEIAFAMAMMENNDDDYIAIPSV